MQPGKELEQLIRAAQRDNRAAVEEIVRRFQPLVWATARRWALQPDLVDDLAQEGNLALLTAIYNFRPGTAPFTWYVKRQVYYAVRYALRCSQRLREREGTSLDAPLKDGLGLAAMLASDQPGPEEQALSTEDKEAFWHAVAKLTRRQQQVVAGRLKGLTFAAIARQLNIAPSTAKGAYARAEARLKKVLAHQVQIASVRQSISEGGRKEV